MRSVILVFLVIFLAACAGDLLKPIPLAVEEKAKIRSSGAITVTMQKTIGFLFNTPSGAVVDAGLARWKDPSKAPNWAGINRMHKVPDFTESVRNKFISALKKKSRSYKFVAAKQREPHSYKQETDYVDKYKSKYVLEFRTQHGSFMYGALSWKTYSLNYFGQARIIRVADKQVVWKGNCSVSSKDNALLQVPVADFINGDGKQFKSAAAHVTSSCAKQLLSSFLSGT